MSLLVKATSLQFSIIKKPKKNRKMTTPSVENVNLTDPEKFGVLCEGTEK